MGWTETLQVLVMGLVTCDEAHCLVIGNIGRYLNHSCEPNLVMVVTIRSSSMVPHLALFTIRNVEKVTFMKYAG